MPEDGKLFLQGDLGQIAAQAEFLELRSFQLVDAHGLPYLVTEKRILSAITLLWENRVPGWWAYESRLIDAGICTQEEFAEALKKAWQEENERFAAARRSRGD